MQMQHGITALYCFCVFILVQTLWSKTTRLRLLLVAIILIVIIFYPPIYQSFFVVTILQLQICQFAEFKSVNIYVTLGSVCRRNICKFHYANILSQAHLAKLPKNLLAKTSLTKNTEHVLQQLPNVISSLDAFMDSSLQSASQIKTVTQLLSNMENTQLKSILPASQLQKDQNNTEPGELRVD